MKIKNLAALAAIATLLGVAGASAAPFNSGSTGAYGPINVTSNTTLAMPADGVFHCTTINVGSGPADVVGKGLIVHRDPDDDRTQPTGNAGPRIACAVIVRS